MNQLRATPKKNPSKLAKVARYFVKNANVVRLIRLHEKVHSLLIRANTELSRLDVKGPVYPLRLREFDQAVLEFQKSKWYAEAAGRRLEKGAWKKCFAAAKRSIALGTNVYSALVAGSTQPVLETFDTLAPRAGSEIEFAGEVPILPQSNPLVFLQGSDYEMGYQYAQQVIQIFGTWIFAHKAGRSFTVDEDEVHRSYEEQMRQHTPELLDFIAGWAAGATEAGVAMSYEDVLDIWTGHAPPASFYHAKGDWNKAMDRVPILCSGMAAWGRATGDGKLVTGSSGDHDATFMVTIVAFPDTGNAFIYSPFSVYGDVPIVGNVGMMGHPGMNARGLAYVHHGGVPKMIEDPAEWGYGVRRGMSVFHVLRFADNAREALAMEMRFPVGDVGLDPANTAGGFYADSEYGYIAESRKNPVAIREAGLLGETDFLYANNSAAHPLAEEAGWMQPYREQWTWEPHGGWRPVTYRPPTLVSLRKPSGADLVNAIQSLMYFNSCGRNNYAFRALHRCLGQIDYEYMKQIYRRSGVLPAGSFEEIARDYKKNGEWGEVTTGHAGNALVVIMKPADGLYSVCVGPVARGLTAHAPYPHSGPIYGETNAFWEIHLASSPAGVMESAAERARECLREAEELARGREHSREGSGDGSWQKTMYNLLDRARGKYHRGEQFRAEAAAMSGHEALYCLSRATRRFNHAQVLAVQAIQMVVPPARLPIVLENE